MDLNIRNRIYRIVSKNAGSHLRELERKSGISYSTLKYHLHFLVKHDLLIEKYGKGNVRYYPKNLKIEEMEILGLLRQRSIRKILLFMLTNKKCSLKDMGNYTGLSVSTLSWYMERLGKKNVVERYNFGKKVVFKLKFDKEKIFRVMITYRKSFVDSLVDKAIEMWDV